MNYIKYSFVIIFFSFISFFNYASKKDNNIIYKSYYLAKEDIQYKQYTESINILKKINDNYPLNKYSHNIQINLIYAYYKENNLLQCKTLITKFLKLFPNCKKKDFLFYVLGKSYFSISNNKLRKIFSLYYYNQNLKYNRLAFNCFTRLIIHYPNSKYSLKAKKMLLPIQEELAKHELSIIKYYYQCHAYISVINRVVKFLHDFKNTNYSYYALDYMKKSFYELNLKNEALNITKLVENKNNLIK